MDKTIKNNLCKHLRASSLPKEKALSILNTIEKWYDSSGEQWTVDRLKSLHHWYITVKADNPEPPPWCGKHSKSEPKGPFKEVFRMENPQLALSILSCHTAFIAERPSEIQISKFEKALAGNKTSPINVIVKDSWHANHPLPKLVIGTPGFQAISGKSIPLTDGNKIRVDRGTDQTVEQVISGYIGSWRSTHPSTLHFIERTGEIDIIPPAYLCQGKLGEPTTLGWNRRGYVQETAGSIGCIQEPSLKARWIANPNRITQWTLRPLADHWYSLLKSTKTDCTFDQESGVRWVQGKLHEGVRLSGADLSSASDLLHLESSLKLLCAHKLGRDINNPSHWSEPVDKLYKAHIDYFTEVSRLSWDNTHVPSGISQWKQGQPLGTAPSFALLGLTNNSLGQLACKSAGIPKDSFRVIGDDIIMDSRAFPHYERLIVQMGGEINRSKTIESDKLAEFAGRIITPHTAYAKRIKAKEMSDNSFMAVMAKMGDRAKSLLRPRQRKMYDTFKYVPGIAVPGPYSDNSFGVGLEYRYHWYLKYSNLPKEKLEPDKVHLTPGQFCSQLYHVLRQNRNLEDTVDILNCVVPLKFRSDFQSDLAHQVVAKVRDPRFATEGTELLQVLEKVSLKKDFLTFSDYLSRMQKFRGSEDPSDFNPAKRSLVFSDRLESAVQALDTRVTGIKKERKKARLAQGIER